uniref:MALT1 immunoglobulin-like domain-containing protein n=1 Tax=Hucho hucho TaxID=62062 RepID=A0A4W5MXC8_9TELE
MENREPPPLKTGGAQCTYGGCNVVFLLLEIMFLDFECGAQLKLGFAAEFSNVLVIYTHIIKKTEDMSFCQAHVTNFSLDQLGFTLCLQDSFKAVDELVDWTTDVNIGKPLIMVRCSRPTAHHEEEQLSADLPHAPQPQTQPQSQAPPHPPPPPPRPWPSLPTLLQPLPGWELQ